MVSITTPSGTSSTLDKTIPGKGGGDFNDLDTEQFLKLLVTELSNQDPLNPMDNAQLVQQISSIRDITATTKLTEALDVVTNGQNLASATALIGKKVNALTDKGDDVTGVVDRVTVEVDEKDNSRTYRVKIGTNSIDIKNVREVLPN
jgi:flagellar basal-body rod modification protein FlgD